MIPTKASRQQDVNIKVTSPLRVPIIKTQGSLRFHHEHFPNTSRTLNEVRTDTERIQNGYRTDTERIQNGLKAN
ncbi:hypothetical protein [Capnocytophaga haemolytica]